MNLCRIVIDQMEIEVKRDVTVLEAAQQVGIHIPTLCRHPELKPQGRCRVCVVEDTGSHKLITACNTPVNQVRGAILTHSAAVREARKTMVELLLADHPRECLSCVRNMRCELQNLAREEGVDEYAFDGAKNFNHRYIDKNISKWNENPSFVRDNRKCIRCGRCVDACRDIQSCDAIGDFGRGKDLTVSTAFHRNEAQSSCVLCGKCITVCPVGALYEKSDEDKVWQALEDPNRFVVFQTAPSVRVGIGDDFDRPKGAVMTGQMVAALRRLGADRVIDTNFAADLTIMEEGTELYHRLREGGTLPMITSCSPGWINFVEKHYPHLLDHLSSCKSPQQMFGAMTKTYYAEKIGVDPSKMFVVSVMPCVAKKYERTRPGMDASGYPDIDVVLTTRELSRMLQKASIRLEELSEEDYDSIMGTGSGAATIFGTSGGVMEAALRTVYEVVTGEEIPALDLVEMRGHQGIKTAEVDLQGTKVRVAIAHGLAHARVLMEEIERGESPYHFIEIMACPGGCIGGGGQPFRAHQDPRRARMEGLYQDDREHHIRKSHENPEIQKVYLEFLGEPNSHRAHELLHTTYRDRRVCR